MKKIIFILFLTFLIFPFVQATNLSLYPNPGVAYAGSSVQYSFNFSNATNCDPANNLLSYTTFITIDTRGTGFVSIDITNLTSVPIKLCEGREGILRANHSFSDIIFNTIYASNLNISSDAIVRGNVFVTGNVTTSAYFVGDGSYLTGVTGSFNNANLAYVNNSNTWEADQNFSGNSLTNLGELIMEGYIKSQNLTPVTTNLYSLGNSTNWFDKLFVRTINSVNINATNLNATNVQSENINTSNLNASDIKSKDIKSDRINTSNITIGGYNISTESGNLVIDLG